MKGIEEMSNKHLLTILILIKELILINDNKKSIQILDKLISELK